SWTEGSSSSPDPPRRSSAPHGSSARGISSPASSTPGSWGRGSPREARPAGSAPGRALTRRQHQRQQHLIDDRFDASPGHRLRGHEDVVSNQVDGHVEDRVRQTVQVDLTTVMCALIDGAQVLRPVRAQDPVPELRDRQPRRLQQARERRSEGTREEARTLTAHALHQPDEVGSQTAAVRHLDRVSAPVVLAGGERQLVVVRPRPAQRRYSTAMPVCARAATDSMVNPAYPASASSSQAACRSALSNSAPLRRVRAGRGVDEVLTTAWYVTFI